MIKAIGMIPALSAPAANLMTMKNLEAAEIKLVSYRLYDLLMKPGNAYLSTLPSLSTYTAWHKTYILNASMPLIDANHRYKIRSDYDGSLCSYTIDDIFALINTLKPAIAILPQAWWQKNTKLDELLNAGIFPFMPAIDLPENFKLNRSYGIYYQYNDKDSVKLLHELSIPAEHPRYVAGDLNLSLMSKLVDYDIAYIESNRAILDAGLGLVYTNTGDISVLDTKYSLEFTRIDEYCTCHTCRETFTRAYLHHLYLHTPLLCQRLLAQHNMYFCQNILCKK